MQQRLLQRLQRGEVRLVERLLAAIIVLSDGELGELPEAVRIRKSEVFLLLVLSPQCIFRLGNKP